MSDEASDTLELRYVGDRFNGGRLPLAVLPELSAFRDLIIAVAREAWFSENPGRRRVPKGFNQSVLFNLIDIKDASAAPVLQWDRASSEVIDADLSEEISRLIDISYSKIACLFVGAAGDALPAALPSDQIAALNKFGASLQGNERVELIGQNDLNGKVIYLDAERRKRIITSVSQTYDRLIAATGILKTASTNGYVEVHTNDYGNITIPLEPDLVKEQFNNGNLDEEIQFEILVKFDRQDRIASVVGCLQISMVGESNTKEFRVAMKRLEELASLRAGWLDDAGSDISEQAIDGAKAVLNRRRDLVFDLGIFPTVEGGINLEFVRNSWDFTVEILPSGSYLFFGASLDGEEDFEPIEFDRSIEKLLVALQGRIGAAADA